MEFTKIQMSKEEQLIYMRINMSQQPKDLIIRELTSKFQQRQKMSNFVTVLI